MVPLFGVATNEQAGLDTKNHGSGNLDACSHSAWPHRVYTLSKHIILHFSRSPPSSPWVTYFLSLTRVLPQTQKRNQVVRCTSPKGHRFSPDFLVSLPPATTQRNTNPRKVPAPLTAFYIISCASFQPHQEPFFSFLVFLRRLGEIFAGVAQLVKHARQVKQ